MAATLCIIFCFPSVNGCKGDGGINGKVKQTQLERVKLPLFGMIAVSQTNQMSHSDQP